MNEQVETDLITAIQSNAKSASANGVKADDALKYTQAALNAAHAVATMRAMPQVQD